MNEWMTADPLQNLLQGNSFNFAIRVKVVRLLFVVNEVDALLDYAFVCIGFHNELGCFVKEIALHLNLVFICWAFCDGGATCKLLAKQLCSLRQLHAKGIQSYTPTAPVSVSLTPEVAEHRRKVSEQQGAFRCRQRG